MAIQSKLIGTFSPKDIPSMKYEVYQIINQGHEFFQLLLNDKLVPGAEALTPEEFAGWACNALEGK